MFILATSEVRVVGAADADGDLRSEWRCMRCTICGVGGEILTTQYDSDTRVLLYDIAPKSLPNQSEHSVALFWVQNTIWTGPTLTPLLTIRSLNSANL
jgi:hypothetical protein